MLSVIIAALNEAPSIGVCVDAAFAAGAREVILSDGGSSDATRTIAEAHGARAISGEAHRARQFNRGAAAATHDELLFLHADTLLPRDAANAVHDALEAGAHFGGFRLAFIEDALKLRIAAAMINLRTAITRCPWGDQAQFIRRADFDGFRELAIMEDYELAIRMKRRGRIAILPLTVRTSARRFLQRGVLRTAAINWQLIIRYRLGANAGDLARTYRGSSEVSNEQVQRNDARVVVEKDT
jgi:rSAM/selenodomain-associated transferase 2